MSKWQLYITANNGEDIPQELMVWDDRDPLELRLAAFAKDAVINFHPQKVNQGGIMRALDEDNLAKTINPDWTVTEILQRLLAHHDEETDVFEGEELSLNIVAKLLVKKEAL